MTSSEERSISSKQNINKNQHIHNLKTYKFPLQPVSLLESAGGLSFEESI